MKLKDINLSPKMATMTITLVYYDNWCDSNNLWFNVNNGKWAIQHEGNDNLQFSFGAIM